MKLKEEEYLLLEEAARELGLDSPVLYKILKKENAVYKIKDKLFVDKTDGSYLKVMSQLLKKQKETPIKKSEGARRYQQRVKLGLAFLDFYLEEGEQKDLLNELPEANRESPVFKAWFKEKMAELDPNKK